MGDGSWSERVEQRASRLTVWLLPVVVVVVFIQPAFEPYVALGRITIDPPDVLAAVAIVAAVLELRRGGRRPDGVAGAWTLLALILLYALAQCFVPLSWNSSLNWKKHLVTWGKFTELACLAPAAAVLFAVPGTLRALARTVVVLTVTAAVVGVVQFAGVDIFRGWGRANREPSFTGVHELGALGALAVTLAFVATVHHWLLSRRWASVGAIAGLACLALSGAIAVGIGLGAAAIFGLLVGSSRGWIDRRFVAAAFGALVLAASGVLILRAGDISQFTRYMGLAQPTRATTSNIQTYAQRSLQLYIGYRVWRTHPVLGSGWAAVKDPSVFEPQLPAAHRQFPDQPLQAFPSRKHLWGVDNAYVQVLAELGIVGFVMFVTMLVVLLSLGIRRSLRDPPEQARRALLATMWVLLCAGIWIGDGLIVAPFTDILWLGIGLLAATGLRSPRDV